MHGETSDATVAKFVRGWILIYVENMSTVRCNNVEPSVSRQKSTYGTSLASQSHEVLVLCCDFSLF